MARLSSLVHIEITVVIAESFLDNTTSHGSGGLWEPYKVEGTPDEIINIFKEAAPDEKNRVSTLLNEIDPSNSTKYQKIGK